MAHNDTHAARKKGGAGKILLVVLLLLLLAVGAAVHFAYNEIHGNGAPGSTEVTVSIPQQRRSGDRQQAEGGGRHPLCLPVSLVCGTKGRCRKAAVRRFCLADQCDFLRRDHCHPFPVRQAETVRVTIPEAPRPLPSPKRWNPPVCAPPRSF